MARVQEILTNVRYRLNDTAVGNQRWDDVYLLRLLNSGLRDLVRRSRVLTDTAIIPLVDNQSSYVLPINLIELTAVIYRDKELPLVSSRQLEATKGKAWRTRTTAAKLTNAVYDKVNSRNLRVYPVPTTVLTTGTYQLTPTANGVDVALIGAANPAQLYGVISGVTVAGSDVGTPYGVFTGGTVLSEVLVLVYERFAALVTDLLGDPETPETADQALEYYIVGHALRSDTNQENRAFGAEELKLYFGEVNALRVIESHGTVGSDHQPVRYSGMGL